MNWLTSRLATAVWLLAFLALFANFALTAYNLRWMADDHDLLRRSYVTINLLNELFSTVKDAETGQRGFLITGDEAYLRPYENAVEILPRLEDKLRQLQPGKKPALDQLFGLIDERLAVLHELIEMRRTEGHDAARQALLTGRGKHAMDALRELIGEFRAEQEKLLDERSVQSRSAYQIAMTTDMLGAAAALGMTTLAFLLIRRELRIRRRNEAALRQAHDEMEARVAQRTFELSSANDALTRSNRELEQFAYVASHDLQEPLRKIQAFGDRLANRCGAEVGDQGREYLQRILTSATRMRQLIDALLTYSRVATRPRQLVPVDLDQVARDVLVDLENRLQGSGGSVELKDLPTLDADALQMRQLFQNLIGNGLKFARPGVAPIVRVTGEIKPAADGEPDCCILTFADNGVGFDQAYEERLFQMFQRLHRRDEYEGTGIGLAICRKIVERHQGRISAQGLPGEGAKFEVTLPLRQPNGEVPPHEREAQSDHHSDGRR